MASGFAFAMTAKASTLLERRCAVGSLAMTGQRLRFLASFANLWKRRFAIS
jgi:hypothetical protein